MDTSKKELLKLLTQNTHYHAYQLFEWMLDDVLADIIGQRKKFPPPLEAVPAIREISGCYAKCVKLGREFEDILGDVYQEIAASSTQKHFGQYFTPFSVATLMAQMTMGDLRQYQSDDRICTVMEPACGSGAMILAFARAAMNKYGPDILPYLSFTAIDKDSVCARMCAVQFMSNLFVHRLTLGEICVYSGNSLTFEDFKLIVHASKPGYTPPPADDPKKLTQIRSAALAKTHGEQISLF